MVRRNVRARFHTVYWRGRENVPADGAVVFACTHHGWHDGYLMFVAVTALGKPSVDWVEEYDAFPLFSRIGALPMPPDDAPRRLRSLRQTVRLMREGVSLVHFPEGVLHRGPGLLEFGKAMGFLQRALGKIPVVPVAIAYHHSVHERPEAVLEFLPAVTLPDGKVEDVRAALEAALAARRAKPGPWAGDEVLAKGTPDVNERWDMRRGRN